MSEMLALKYRVLLIERDYETKRLLQEVLDENQFQCDVESSPVKGYKKIQKQHYDLIISEVALDKEELTGIDLLQKAREGNLSVPFIIISDQSSVETSVRAINFGVAGFLVKPLVASEALETINRAIRYHKGRFLKNELENYTMENAFQAVVTSEEKSILKLLDTIDNLIELVYPNDYSGFSDLKMAIYESLSNAVEHGNHNQPDKNVFFRLELKMDRVTVHVKDEGDGFDRQDISSTTFDVVKGLNRGLNLIHHLMDEVSFNTKGNEINLLKILR